MLPIVVSRQLLEGLREFLRTTFPVTTPGFLRGDGSSFVDDFLQAESALAKGPWLEVKLPFRLALGENSPFSKFPLRFVPWQHQMRSFQRLSGPSPKSAIVATGTGSGKTECFMYPVLEHCLLHRDRGIKAIVIYPMNALATDQARRFARECHSLSPKLSVGLYTGDDGTESRSMTPEQVITHRQTLRENPPDILLTNYKMLDFLMLRPADQKLWRFNKPGALRYLVVDELHTFDGAQGTDLACLVRRLRDKLGAGAELACVGTSATIGSGPDAVADLCAYATQVFATPFDEAAIILEDRLSVDEYLLDAAGSKDAIARWPTDALEALQPVDAGAGSQGVYLRRAAQAWTAKGFAFDAEDEPSRFKAAVELGKVLPSLTAFQELLRESHQLQDIGKLAEAWQQRLRLPHRRDAELLIDSLCALVSAARLTRSGAEPTGDLTEKELAPFLQVRVQLWLRELRRMVGKVAAVPELTHADDVRNLASPLHLPVLHCRECHAVSWGSIWPAGETKLKPDLQAFYQAWFNKKPDARLIYPAAARPASVSESELRWLCLSCLAVTPLRGGDGTCRDCSGQQLAMWMPEIRQRVAQRDADINTDCPICSGHESLAVMGSRAASIASVLIGDLFGSSYNDDHKLIAFSDSVQDAAHRAGFFGARTFSQVLRQAMADFVRHEGEGLQLSHFADELPRYWRRRCGSDETFVGTFIAPNMEWLQGFRTLREQGSIGSGSDIADLVAKRLRWEALVEFGLRSRIGRTLERTGTASVALDEPGLKVAAKALGAKLREELGTLKDIPDEKVESFLLGLLTHARHKGAFYDPVLQSYVREGGNDFLLTQIPFMPGYGLRTSPPAMLSLKKVSNNFETVLGKDQWYLHWFNKCLAVDQPLATAEFEQAYTLTFGVLEQQGWLLAQTAKQMPVWGLNPARWSVMAQARDMVCGACNHRLPVSMQQDHIAAGLACLRNGCIGHYRVAPMRKRSSPYKSQPHRLVPAEHTALLDGQLRHQIEQSFIHGSDAWDINLLSATPTLEMGIDIGDLSTVLLCSVPPAQANYLQRIGRAGRRDGNALALTIAGGHRHDLYFYSAPLEMLAGAVSTPGVFLKAMAVLERQLLAFCFDRWVSTGVDSSALPGLMREVLDAVETDKVAGFPYNLLGFVDANSADLLDRFCAMFEDMDTEGRAHLKGFIAGTKLEGTLGWRVLNRLKELAQSRKSLKDRIDELRKRIKQLETQPEDESRNHLLNGSRDERSALIELAKNMNARLTLNFFTDEGLLPNYAFPEEGVTLNSVILRRREVTEGGEEKRRYEALSMTFQRSAHAALGELVPEARFYAAEHQLHIDQIDLKLTKPQSWRLCPACHYSENLEESGDPHAVCPRCGNAMWADAGQRRTMLKLRQVYARADTRRDRIGDDSDQREHATYRRQLLIDIPLLSQAGGFRIDNPELPFGFEYIRDARFREVNFGEPGDVSDAFNVAGRQESRKGFQVCKHCGTVRRKRLRKGQFAHALDCVLSKQGAVEQESDWIDSLYLYRELSSEAIRILLPLSDVAESDTTRRSFIAALNMGLKRYFKGNVQHLEIAEMQEPAVGGHSPKQYLVVYDRIPGGTGYLKELMRSPDILLDLLQQAHDHLASCECVKDAERDGCYRCILAYRDSQNMSEISRKSAQGLLRRVLDSRHLLKAVDRLSDIQVNAMFGSVLEARFVSALTNHPALVVTKHMVNGKPGYWIGMPGEEAGAPMWELEPQVMLGSAQGVAIQTEADFVLRPVRLADRQQLGEWVLYLDGFGPHHPIQTDDTRKRMAVLRSGRRVWTLAWHDLPTAGTKPDSVNETYLTSHRSPQWLQAYDKLAERFGWSLTGKLDQLIEIGPYGVLVRLLTLPTATLSQLHELPIALAIGWLHKPSLEAKLLDSIDVDAQRVLPSTVRKAMAESSEHLTIGGLLPGIGRDTTPVRLLSVMPKGALTSKERLLSQVSCHICLDETAVTQTKEFELVWRGFWYAANMLQLAPGFTVATEGGVGVHAYESALSNWGSGDLATVEEHESQQGTPWAEVMGDAEIDSFALGRLADAGLPVPVVGLDLTHGLAVVANAELAWPGQSIAVLLAVEQGLQVDGWTLIGVTEDGWIDRVIAQFATNGEKSDA